MAHFGAPFVLATLGGHKNSTSIVGIESALGASVPRGRLERLSISAKDASYQKHETAFEPQNGND
jgi:hypothetical protein